MKKYKNNWSEIFVPFTRYLFVLKSQVRKKFDNTNMCLLDIQNVYVSYNSHYKCFKISSW